MAIDVDWAGTDANPHRIFVPRADMSVVQANPEIRELNLDTFRLDLRAAEAMTLGRPWPETHLHTAPATLSGTVFVRRVQILAPYQVEFEDGQYSVRVTGGNHNIGDVKIANSVGIIVTLSGGAIEVPSVSSDQVAAIFTMMGLDPSHPRSVDEHGETAGTIKLTYTQQGGKLVIKRVA